MPRRPGPRGSNCPTRWSCCSAIRAPAPASCRRRAAVGIELPLRILVWDDGGRTRIGFRDPTALAAEYGIEAHRGTLERMHLLLDALAAEAEGDGTQVGPG